MKLKNNVAAWFRLEEVTLWGPPVDARNAFFAQKLVFFVLCVPSVHFAIREAGRAKTLSFHVRNGERFRRVANVGDAPKSVPYICR